MCPATWHLPTSCFPLWMAAVSSFAVSASFYQPCQSYQYYSSQYMHIFSDLLQRKPRVKSPTPKLYTFHQSNNQKTDTFMSDVPGKFPNTFDTLQTFNVRRHYQKLKDAARLNQKSEAVEILTHTRMESLKKPELKETIPKGPLKIQESVKSPKTSQPRQDWRLGMTSPVRSVNPPSEVSHNRQKLQKLMQQIRTIGRE